MVLQYMKKFRLLGALMANPSIKRDWRKRSSMNQFSITRVEPPMSPAPYVKRSTSAMGILRNIVFWFLVIKI